MMKRLFISILILLWASTALAQLVMDVLPVNHSRAEALVPAINGILEGQGNVVVIQNKLVVRATPQKMAQIKSLLKQIDTPLQNLRITVKQGFRQDIERQDKSLSADVTVANSGRIHVGSNREASDGVSVTARSGNSSLGGHFRHNNSAERDLVSQQILTLEGHPAIIHMTKSIPTRIIRKGQNAQGKYQEEVTVFRDASIGFSVVPRLVGKGEEVILEISPEHSRFRGSRVETFGAHTTVRGKLGEWIEIGGIEQTESSVNRGILADSKIDSRQNRTIFLKVEKTQ